jgi:hypothetical protein
MQPYADLMLALRPNAQALRLAQFACFAFAALVGEHRYAIRSMQARLRCWRGTLSMLPAFTIGA